MLGVGAHLIFFVLMTGGVTRKSEFIVGGVQKKNVK